MSRLFTATSMQIDAIQIIRDYINANLVICSSSTIGTVKDFLSRDLFESYLQIPLYIRGPMELSAQVYFDKGPYESTSKKNKSKCLCYLVRHTTSCLLSEPHPTFSLPDVYLPLPMLPIVHCVDLQPILTVDADEGGKRKIRETGSRYVVQDVPFSTTNSSHLRTAVNKVKNVLKASLNDVIGVDMPIRQHQILQVVAEQILSEIQEDSYPTLKREMIESFLLYIKDLKKYGIDDKHQRSHIVDLLASILPMDTIAYKHSQLKALLEVGDKLVDRARCKRKQFRDITQIEREAKETALMIHTEKTITSTCSSAAMAAIGTVTMTIVDDELDDGNRVDTTEEAPESSDSEQSTESTTEDTKEQSKTPIAVNAYIRRKQRRRKHVNPYKNMFFSNERKDRKDKIEQGVVTDFTHNCSMFCRLDTGLHNQRKLIENKDDNTTSYHSLLVRCMSNEDAYPLFLQSRQYSDWQIKHTSSHFSDGKEIFVTPTIKLSSFLSRICPCVVDATMQSCANVPIVDFNNLLKAFCHFLDSKSAKLSKERCAARGCTECSNNVLRESCKTITTLMKSCLCPKTSYPQISSQPRDIGTEEEAENANIESANEQLRYTKEEARLGGAIESSKRSKIMPQLNTIKGSDYSGHFSIHSNACCTGKCHNCLGIATIFGEQCCTSIIDENENQMFDVWKFLPVPRGKIFQKEAGFVFYYCFIDITHVLEL